MKELFGIIDGKGLKIAIVVSRFNDLITNSLLNGAKEALKRHGVKDESITIVSVPGAYEIPLAAKLLAKRKKIDAVICLGAVIKGATPHFDFVCQAASSGILQTMLETEIPIIFGILTTNSFDEALERAGGKAGNKGFDAAIGALEMVSLKKQII